MTTPNTGLDTTLAASTSQHGSEAPFSDVPPQRTASLGHELDYGSASLDFGTGGTPPPSSSLKVSTSDADHASGSKRKQEDRDDASDAEARTLDRKKLKQEDSPDESASSLITPRHMFDEVVGVEGLVNEPQLSGLLSPEDESTHSTDLPRSVPSLPDASPLSTVPVDLPPPMTPPPRSHTAPPTSPVIASRTHHFPPSSSLSSDPEPLHTYSCPICFSSPTNATLTPCGHVMCGECLFTAVGAAAARMGIAALAARCPVCRAPIPRWDGRGGGVIGLQPRVVITI